MIEFPEKIDSKFRFVLLAARRAEQMMRGGRPKMEHGQNKVTRAAMNEIKGGVVDWDYGQAPDPADDLEALGTQEELVESADVES